MSPGGSETNRMKISKRRCWKCTRLVAVLLHVVGGSSRASNVDGEQVFQYDLWIPLTVLLVGLVGIAIGWVLRKAVPRLGWSMLVLGTFAAGIIAPSMFRE